MKQELICSTCIVITWKGVVYIIKYHYD